MGFRSAFIRPFAVLALALEACGGAGGGADGGGPVSSPGGSDGGEPNIPGGGGGSGGGCSAADVVGPCGWPQFCVSNDAGALSCADPQNVSGVSDSPGPACDYGAGGGENVDAQRASAGTPFGSNGPILMSLVQDSSQANCGQNGLGGGDPAHPALCLGDGRYCGASDSVVLFEGSVYDPGGAFATAEGALLDGQFYRVIEGGAAAGTGDPLSDVNPSLASVQIGHVVPGPGWQPGASWGPTGGDFALWRCFLGAQVGGEVDAGAVLAHYAQTSGAAGNTFCATWTAAAP